MSLYQIADISADTIVQALEDYLIRMNIQWVYCRGQCNDSAANMEGQKNGVARKILKLSPEHFTHIVTLIH